MISSWWIASSVASASEGALGELGLGADGPQAVGEGAQRLGLQDRGPHRHEVARQVGVGRLEGVVPVAVAVGGQRAAGDGALLDPADSAGEVLGHPQRLGQAVVADEGDDVLEEVGLPAGEEVLPGGEQRPEHDVAVRVLLARGGQRREELEGLRPVAAGVLRPEDPAEQLADDVLAVEGGEQADRPLADVTGAPPAAGVLLRPRGER